MKGFRTLRGSNHLEDMRKEPRKEEPRALEWIFPGSAGSLPASPGDGPAFLARSGGGRYSSLEQSPNLRRKGERPQDAETRGSPYAALEPPALGRPGQGQDTAASAPEPCPAPAPAPADGHRDLAPPGHPLCRLRTGSARGVPARHLRLSPAARSHHT